MASHEMERIAQASPGTAAAMPDAGDWAPAFARAGIGLIVTDAVTQTIRTVNAAFAERRGYRPDEMPGMPVACLFPPEHLSEARRQVAEADRLGHHVFECAHVCRDGTQFPVLVDITVSKAADGSALSRLAHVIDVSALKAADARLQEQQALLAQVSAVAHIAGWVYDKATGTGRWTGELNSIYEIPEGQRLDLQASYDLYVPEDRRRVRQAIRAAVEDGVPYDIEARIRVPSGEKWVHSVGLPVVEDGKVVQLRGTLQDITARKQFELRLRSEEDRRRAMFDEASPDAVFVTDDCGRIVEANQRACDSLGVTPAELHEMDLFAIETSATREALQAEWQRAVPGQRRRVYGHHRRKDGTTFPVEVHYSVLVEDGRRLCVSYARDISEHVRAENSLRESERRYRELSERLEERVIERTSQLEQASRAKTDFLANMSHELRTPLNAIIGFSELLRDGILGPLAPQHQRYVSDIWDAGKHLHELINDMLDLSKVEAGTLELEPRAVAASALFESTLVMVSGRAAKQDVALRLHVAPELGTIVVDPRKVKQIVYNLLTNATKFTPAGGSVELVVRRSSRPTLAGVEMPTRVVSTPRSDAQDFVEICVQDTGAGIAAEDLGKLFEPFVQLKESYSRSLEGTGLGLSLVRRFAELHGGTAGVASAPGRGSHFHVWLPYIPG